MPLKTYAADTLTPVFKRPNVANVPDGMPQLSVVIPMYNEAENAPLLLREVVEAFKQGDVFEIVVVDDMSTDSTLRTLVTLQSEIPQLRVLQHGCNAGQSRSLRTGIMSAKAPVIATLDGDGQNDPADIGRLWVQLVREDAPSALAMVAGQRRQRQDSAAKKVASRWANGIRKKLLNDGTDDTGCGLKVFYRDAFLRLPYFDHVHRYIPALMRREGVDVEFADVHHRFRMHGVSKYTNWQRAAVAIRDLMAVIWLKHRARLPGDIVEH